MQPSRSGLPAANSGLAAPTAGAVLALAVALIAGSAVLLTPARPAVAQPPGPADVVATLHRALTDAAAADLDREARFERLAPVVDKTHDLPYIAELTIRRAWPDLDAAERATFVAAFRRLSIMTYATRFVDVDPDVFDIVGSDLDSSGRIWVRARIERADAEPIPLEYLLHETDDGWRIVNILADGVSDLALKRAEYQRILAGGTLADLVAALNRQAQGPRNQEGNPEGNQEGDTHR